jgi:hypothetical protein
MFFPNINYILILVVYHHVKLDLLIHIYSDAWSDVFNGFRQQRFAYNLVLELAHQRVYEHHQAFVRF